MNKHTVKLTEANTGIILTTYCYNRNYASAILDLRKEKENILNCMNLLKEDSLESIESLSYIPSGRIIDLYEKELEIEGEYENEHSYIEISDETMNSLEDFPHAEIVVRRTDFKIIATIHGEEYGIAEINNIPGDFLGP